MGYTFPTSSNDNEILTGSIIPVGDRKFVASKSGGATFLNPVSDYSTSPEYFRGSILEQDDTTYALLHLQQTSYSDSEDDSYFSVPYAVNNVTANADSKFGTNAASFNGTDSHIEYKVNDIIDASGPFTWECWIKANTSTSLRTVMGQVSDTQVMSGLFVQTKDNQIKLFNGTTELLSIANDLTGSYHHLAICKFTDFYEQEVLKVFKNGELIGETSGTNVDNLTRQYIPFSLGKDVGSNYFSGKLQELRVTQGFARYHENFTPPTTPFNVSNDGVTHLKFNNDSYLPTDNSDDVAFLTVVSQEEEVYTGGIDQNTEVMLSVENNTLVDESVTQQYTLGNTTVTENSDSNFSSIKSWNYNSISSYPYYDYDWNMSDQHTIDFWAKADSNSPEEVTIVQFDRHTISHGGEYASDKSSWAKASGFSLLYNSDKTKVTIALRATHYKSQYSTARNYPDLSATTLAYGMPVYADVQQNSWNHYAIVLSRNTEKEFEFYVNGEKIVTVPPTTIGNVPYHPNDPIWSTGRIGFGGSLHNSYTRLHFGIGFNSEVPWGNDLIQQLRITPSANVFSEDGFNTRDAPYNDDTARQITNANLMFVNNGKVKSLTTTSNFTNLKRDYIELNQQTTLPSSNNTIVYVDSSGELRTSGSFGDKKISLLEV